MKKIFKILPVFFAVFALLFSCKSESDNDDTPESPNKLEISAEDEKTSLNLGETVQLKVTPESSAIVWSSSNSKIASVNTTGLVQVASELPSGVTLPYTVTITAYNADSDNYGTISLTINQSWASKAAEAEKAGKAVTLSTLNCRNNIDFDENGKITDLKKEGALSNSDDALAYLVYPVNVTKSSSITIEARIKYSATSNTNGPALIIHNGETCSAYRALTDQGVKNIKVDPSCTDFKKTGGNGYTYYTGYNASYLLANEVIGKVIVENGSATMSYFTVSGDPIATKSHNFADYFADGAIVNLAIGGKTSELMTISDIYITENNERKLVTKIDNSGLQGLSVEESKIRVKLNESVTVNAVAVNAGGVAAEVNVVSSNPENCSVSAARPNENNISVITITGNAVGTYTVTITHKDAPKLTKTIEVSIDDFTSTDPYDSLNCYPAVNSEAAYTDGWFRLDFDGTPELLTGGTIVIYKDDGSLVDTILFSDESLAVWDGVRLNVRNQLVYVKGNSLFFMPHYHALEYATKYYIAIPKAAISGTIGGNSFYENGLSNIAKTWSFTTRNEPSAVTAGSTIKVNGDEADVTADFRTIYAAMYAARSVTGDVEIQVEPGTYNELLYYKGTANLTITGPADNQYGDNCVITWNNYEKMNSGTHTRAMFYVNGSNLTLKNLSFVNKFRRNAAEQEGQAECIYFAGGNDKKLVAYNCSFSSYQDTIQTTGRNWFYDCYIEGDVDFIWGTADAALFEKCHLRSLNDENRNQKTADLLVPRTATLTSTIIPKGYVIFNCTLEVDEGITQSLGRVAGTGNFFDQAAVINTNVTGAGLTETIWNNGTAPVGLEKINGIQHVGWKDYGVTVNGSVFDTSKRVNKDYCGTISEEIFQSEYSDRNKILNRVYNKTTKAYEQSSNGAWDLSSFYSEFGITE